VSATVTLPDLSGSVALVTGASDGIGREVALGLARAEAAQPALLAVAMDAASCEFYAPSGMLGISGSATRRRPFGPLMDREAAARMWKIAERLACLSSSSLDRRTSRPFDPETDIAIRVRRRRASRSTSR
jgi:hypothetical protein